MYRIVDNTMNDKNPLVHHCPKCGKSYYRENYSTTTAMWCPPIMKDGVNMNHHTNKSTTHCTCLNCGYDFDI